MLWQGRRESSNVDDRRGFSGKGLALGGGLAGVSTAYHLKNRPSVLIEKEPEVGGTARSFKVGGFTFVLHSHLPYARQAGMWPHGEEWVHEAIAETYPHLWGECARQLAPNQQGHRFPERPWRSK